MSHFDDESLFEYVEGTSPKASEIASHVSSCGECANEVGEQREMITTLGDRDVWQAAPVASPTPRQFIVNVAAFAEQARLEDEQAVILCEEILSGPPAWWKQSLRKTEGAYTAGMVKQLLERMRTLVSSSPANALQVTALAVEVANTLDVTAYPCDYVIKLRAQSLRDHAFVLAFLGRYPEALEVAERSKRLFDQVPLPEYDLARLALVRAHILQSIDRVPEAARLAREAGDTFLRFGDRARYISARLSEGSVMYCGRDLARAMEIWQSIENDPGLDDVAAVRIAHNIALCLSELQRPAEAAEYLVRCVAQFEMLGMQTERTRSRAVLGHALLVAGRAAEAIPVLTRTWREFEQLDMVADAGLAALELAEALLATGRTDEVPAICRDVIAQFTRAGMASRAITALSFLREAVAIGQASPSIVRHVHAFLRELPSDQPRLFAPPPADLRE
ncbi:MAG TPA: tetratricopeptide repeat protein [Thermoanaerobaculia bacterium]|nr:tetratricopeptide repeat protein [Thermoanaerobaculia bacterium]